MAQQDSTDMKVVDTRVLIQALHELETTQLADHTLLTFAQCRYHVPIMHLISVRQSRGF